MSHVDFKKWLCHAGDLGVKGHMGVGLWSLTGVLRGFYLYDRAGSGTIISRSMYNNVKVSERG